MKTSVVSIGIASILVLILMNNACKKDVAIQPQGNNTASTTNQSVNYIVNGSFENGGNFSLNGYDVYPYPMDTSLITSSTDVPNIGNNNYYSLKIYVGSTQGNNVKYGSVKYYVSGISGTGIYTLSCYMKLSQCNNDYSRGYISIGKITNHVFQVLAQIYPDTCIWKHYSITTPISTNSQDSIVIQINGGTSPYSPIKYTLFDLIELTKN